jgi:hypothetical protein
VAGQGVAGQAQPHLHPRVGRVLDEPLRDPELETVTLDLHAVCLSATDVDVEDRKAHALADFTRRQNIEGREDGVHARCVLDLGQKAGADEHGLNAFLHDLSQNLGDQERRLGDVKRIAHGHLAASVGVISVGKEDRLQAGIVLLRNLVLHVECCWLAGHDLPSWGVVLGYCEGRGNGMGERLHRPRQSSREVPRDAGGPGRDYRQLTCMMT